MNSVPSLKLKTSYTEILRFALPISLSILVPQLNYITNNIFLGRLGEKELGTAGITGVYYLIFAVIGSGFNNGLQSLMSRSAGRDDQKEIGRYLAQAMKLVFFLALSGIAITFLITPYLIKSQIQGEEIYNLACSFIKVRILGLPFLYFYQLGNSFLISTNNTKFLIIGSIAEAVANILLDYIFIFGHAGIPAMGFMGAAWASVCAEAVGMIVVHAFLWYQGLPQQFKVREFKGWDRVVTKKTIDRSVPLIFQYLISIVSWLLFYLWIEDLGPRALAISNTMRNVFGIFGVFVWAFAATSNNMVSNVIGQGQFDQVIPLIKKIARLSFFIALILCSILNLFPHAFYSIYSSSEDFTQEAIPVMRVVTIAILLMSQGAIWLNGILGTGLTRINLSIEALTVFIYLAYIYWAVGFPHQPLVWATASELLYWAMLWGASLLFFKYYPWREKYR